MHALGLQLVAVLVYAPPSGHAGGARSEAAEALLEAARAHGAEALDGQTAIERALALRAQGWVGEARLGFFAQGRALVDEARRALERVELERAELRAREAAALYEGELAWPGVATLAAEAELQRGVALFELKRSDEAQLAFRRAVGLDAAAQLTEATVRPDVVRAFQRAVQPGPPAPLTVAAAAAPLTVAVAAPPQASPARGPDPAGGRPGPLAPGPLAPEPLAPGPLLPELLVDGRPVGRGQATAQVAAGFHLVALREDGILPAARLVEVGPSGARVELPAEPDAARAGLRALAERPLAVGLAELAEALGLDEVLVVALGVDAGVLTLAGARADAHGCATPVALAPARDGLGGAAEALLATLGKKQPRCAPSPSVLEAQPVARPRPAPLAGTAPRAPLERPKPRLWERPWLWAGVLAVGAAAVGLGVGLAPQATRYRASVDGASFTR